MRESYVTTLRLSAGESAPASVNTDFVRDASGTLSVNTPSGPQEVATAATVSSAIAARLKKVQLSGTGAVAITSAAHDGAEVHINTGITSVTMARAAWSPTAPNIQVVELYNDTALAVPVTISGFTGGITTDGDASNDIGATGTLLTIAPKAAAVIYADADGWVRGTLKEQVTQAELDAHASLAASSTVAGHAKINNTLTSTATNEALSAAQGKALNDALAFKYPYTVVGVPTDANNVTTSGRYVAGAGAGPLVTGPIANTAWSLDVAVSNNFIFQWYWSDNTSSIYYRKRDNGTTWSSWSQLASKADIDAAVVGLLDYRGSFAPAAVSGATGYPTTGGSGSSGAILKGDTFVASAAGFVLTEAIQTGDWIVAKQDAPGQTAANWDRLDTNLTYVAEDAVNKVTSFSSPTDTQYPSAKLVNDQLAAKASITDTSATKKPTINNSNLTATRDIVLPDRAGMIPLLKDANTSTKDVTLDNSGLSANRNLVVPDKAGTIAVIQTGGAVDANTLTTTGRYVSTGGTLTNGPAAHAGNSAWTLDTVNSNSYIMQWYATDSTNSFHMRKRDNGSSWSAWAKVLTDANPLKSISCRVKLAGNFSVANASQTNIPWTAEDWDTASIHDNVTNTTRLTVPAGYGGLWRITANVEWPASGTGFRLLTYQVNGVMDAWLNGITATQGDAHRSGFSTVVNLVAGDFVEIRCYQNSGGALNVDANNASFAVFEFVGATS